MWFRRVLFRSCGESMIAWDHEDAGIGAGVARRRDAAGSEPGTVDAGAGRAETLCEGWEVRFGRFRLDGRALRHGGDRGAGGVGVGGRLKGRLPRGGTDRKVEEYGKGDEV